MRQFIKPDRVTVTGAMVGLSSLLLDWLTLKPNRLVTGTGLNLSESFGETGAVAIAGIWLFCLILSLVKLRHRHGIALGIISNAIFVLILILTGLASSRLLEGATASARISLSAGFWISLGGAYMVIHSSRRQLDDRPIWQHLISWSGLAALVVLLAVGLLNNVSIIEEFNGYRRRFWQELFQHVRLFGISVAIATVIGIPLGVWATRNKYVKRPIFFTANMVQTVPSLALFGLLIAPLSALSFAFPALRDIGIRGVGVAPAVIALTVYSLLPVVHNAYVGIVQVDAAAVDAGLGMGMSRWQVLLRVEAPLAAPLVLEGVRTASVQAVGLTTMAALIGAGGLGWFVFRGIGQAAPDLIILGAIPVIILALLVDGIMRILVRLGTPKGLSGENR